MSQPMVDQLGCPKPQRRRLKPKRPDEIPAKAREAVRERSRGLCEARLPGCTFRANEMHHRKARSQGGSHAVENLLHLDSHCHRLITEHASGTGAFRTLSWQREGERESDARRGLDTK